MGFHDQRRWHLVLNQLSHPSTQRSFLCSSRPCWAIGMHVVTRFGAWGDGDDNINLRPAAVPIWYAEYDAGRNIKYK